MRSCESMDSDCDDDGGNAEHQRRAYAHTHKLCKRWGSSMQRLVNERGSSEGSGARGTGEWE